MFSGSYDIKRKALCLSVSVSPESVMRPMRLLYLYRRKIERAAAVDQDLPLPEFQC